MHFPFVRTLRTLGASNENIWCADQYLWCEVLEHLALFGGVVLFLFTYYMNYRCVQVFGYLYLCLPEFKCLPIHVSLAIRICICVYTEVSVYANVFIFIYASSCVFTY